MTPRQDQVVAFIASHSAAHGRAPTYTEIGRKLSITRQAVSQLVAKLHRAGRVEKRMYEWRSLRVVA